MVTGDGRLLSFSLRVSVRISCFWLISQRVQLLSRVNAENETVLMTAIQTGKDKMVDAVATLIGETWVPADEVRHTLSRRSPRSYIFGWHWVAVCGVVALDPFRKLVP